MLEITLHEGRKHVVRRLMDTVGHPVCRLVRVRIGPVHLGSLRVGRTRYLSPAEVGALYRATTL
jgi:23S rRNA pseudouridine2605 synthase